jgi:hypothetical protein
MALTASEQQRVLDMLNQMDRSTLKRILASVESFADWLSKSLYSIYVKVKGAIYSMWDSMVRAIGDAVADSIEIGVRVGKMAVQTWKSRNQDW